MTLALSDQATFSITKILYTEFLSEKRQKQLDLDNLDQFKKLYIKPLYPHKQIPQKNGPPAIEKYDCDEYCCELSPGRYCCCGTTAPDSVFKEFGLGVCLYVKFMKHLAWFLFFMSLIAGIAVAVYEVAAYQSGYNITQSYHSTLFSTTVGAISSQYVQCSYATITSNTATFTMQCPIGQVHLLKPVFTTQTLSTLLNCRQQNSKLNAGLFLPDYTVSLSNTSLQSYTATVTISSDQYQGTQYKYLAYNYQCLNSKYMLGSIGMSSASVLYVTIGIDIGIIVFFVVWMISESRAQDKQIQNFRKRELAVHDFTIKVSGFALTAYEQELGRFIEYYDRQYIRDRDTPSLLDSIVQIKVPEVDEIKQAWQARRNYYEKMYELMDYCFFEDNIDINRYRDSQDFIKKCYGTSSSTQYQAYKEELTKLVDKFHASKNVKFMDHEIQISLLLVLSNPKIKKTLLKHTSTGCFGKYFKLPFKKLYLNEPPVADMIIWQNKNKHTCLRVLFAWLITALIFFGSYLLVAFATFKKQQLLNNNKFNVGCDILFPGTQLDTYSESMYTVQGGTYLHCYCNYNYFTLTPKDPNMRTKCSQWFTDYFVYNAIPILISLGIVVYNIIVDRIFRVLSKFEAHDYLSTELYSYIIKRSLMLILNMGLIIILIKLNYKTVIEIKNLSFLFQGTYNDLTSDWYYEIGVIIILTLAFNIIIPIADMIFVSFVKCIRKCIDRQCYCVRTSQKTKKGYLELYVNDVFPIESRYSDFIAMIFITMAFSSVMPILYIIAFLSIWFMFVCDKALLFRVYQKPINYSQDLQNKVFKFLYISLLVHCVSSFFILSEKHLIAANNNITTISRGDIAGIIKTAPYLIPYIVIFVGLGVWGVFHSTIVAAIGYCVEKCERDVSQIYKSKANRNFFASLNKYQINRLKMSTEMQLHNTVQHKSTSSANTNIIRSVCQNTLSKLRQAQKTHALQSKNSLNSNEQQIKLIGKAGYDEMFDDQIFNREKKIKSLDYQFEDIFRMERARKREGNGTKMQIQNTIAELNL